MAKETDVRITPPWIVVPVKEFAAPRLLRDVCTQPDNPIGASTFWTEAEDALSISWSPTCDYVPTTNYCNPPFSRGNVVVWAEYAIRQARLGAEILFLTFADVRTRWYRLLRENADARCHFGRSVGFLEPDGKGGYVQKPGHTMGVALWYFGPRRRRFEQIFSPLGEVIHGLGPQEVSP